MHAFHTGRAVTLSRWAAGLTVPSENVTFFNFLASHDGIGLNPARGLLPETEIEALLRGHRVSYKHNADGTRSPYELNANYLDALGGNPDAFLTAQAIMLSLRGLPGIYFHSLFGSRGWPEGAQQTGRARTINRQKFSRADLEHALADPASERHRIFRGYQVLLRQRAASPAFDPYAPQRVLASDEAVFALLRTSRDGRHAMLCLHNVSAQPRDARLDPREWPGAPVVRLRPYETLWMPVPPTERR